MRYIPLVLCVLALVTGTSAARAATLPNNAPYVITILYDLKITERSRVDFVTNEVVQSYGADTRYSSKHFTFHSDQADFFRRTGNAISMEWDRGGYSESFRYDFDTQRGVLDLGNNLSWVDRYSFNGRDGSYWYETDDDPFYDRIRGKLRKISVFLTAPGEPVPGTVSPVPLPAPVLLLAAGLCALGVFRRRRV